MMQFRAATITGGVAISVISMGIHLASTVFAVHGVNEAGNAILLRMV